MTFNHDTLLRAYPHTPQQVNEHIDAALAEADATVSFQMGA